MIKKIFLEKIPLFVIASIVLFYVWTVYYYTSSMPISDDYGAVLLYLNTYIQLDTVVDKIHMLFAQHNEHRIVFNRIVEIIQYKVTGEVNFLYLTIVGNIGWFLCIYLLWHHSSKSKIVTPYSFLPVIFLMLSFSHAGLTTWAMASIQNYWQITFALFSIYFITNKKYILSLIFMSMAIFTGGAGIALIPVLILYLLFSRQWKYMFMTLSWAMLMLLVYFVFIKYHQQGGAKDYISIIFLNYDRFVEYIFIFLGNIAETKLFSLIVGGIFTGLVLFKSRVLLKKDSFIAYALVFLLTIAVLAAVARSSSGVAQALSSRYGIYSALFVSLVYLQYLAVYKNNNKIILLGYFMGVVSFVYYLKMIPEFEKRKHLAETVLDHPSSEMAEYRLTQSKRLHTFYSWDASRLPSVVKEATHIKGKNQFALKIMNKTLKSLGNNSIKILPSAKQIKIKGWVKEFHGTHKPCALLAEYGGKKQLIYCQPEAFFSKDKKTCYIDSVIGVSNLKPNRALHLQTISSDCAHYYETVDIDIKATTIDELFTLPVVDKELKGWIDKFEAKKNKIYISGWYAQVGKPLLSKTLILDIDGKKYVTRYGYESIGVADVLKNDAYRRAGFRLEINKSDIEIGKHKVQVYVLSDTLDMLYKAKKVFYFDIK